MSRGRSSRQVGTPTSRAAVPRPHSALSPEDEAFLAGYDFYRSPVTQDLLDALRLDSPARARELAARFSEWQKYPEKAARIRATADEGFRVAQIFARAVYDVACSPPAFVRGYYERHLLSRCHRMDEHDLRVMAAPRQWGDDFASVIDDNRDLRRRNGIEGNLLLPVSLTPESADEWLATARYQLMDPSAWRLEGVESAELLGLTITIPIDSPAAFRELLPQLWGTRAFRGLCLCKFTAPSEEAINIWGTTSEQLERRIALTAELEAEVRGYPVTLRCAVDLTRMPLEAPDDECLAVSLHVLEKEIGLTPTQFPWGIQDVEKDVRYLELRDENRPEPPEMDLDELLGLPKPLTEFGGCKHSSDGAWAANADGDALIMNCQECGHPAAQGIPRHRLGPEDEKQFFLPQSEATLVERQRWYQAMAEDDSPIESTEQLRRRDGETDPAGFMRQVRRDLVFQSRSALAVRSVSAAMNRR